MTDMEIHHFEHGWVTPTASYLLSVLGSLLGLMCATRLRAARTGGGRAWWLMLSAVAIGGTGIWTMHFVGMLGFDVVGTPIRYDPGMTAASAGLAIVAVGAGLLVVFGGERARTLRLLAGGLLAGLGVAGMHYVGMEGVHLNGEILYDTTKVAASVLVAVVAATAALWLTATVRRPAAIAVGALVMGIAVNGMHYTGMAAMSVRSGAPDGSPAGVTGSSLLIPIGLAAIFAILGLVSALMAIPTDEDREAAAYLAARARHGERTPAAAQRPAFGGTPAAAQQPAFGGAPAGQQRPAFGGTPSSAPAPAPAPAAGDAHGTGRVPRQRRSALGDASWTYRDRTPRQ
ncbi:MHYT domain-containing protein [Couchioplanes azureus]|uniref:MHYT domain-containing protein n=1 Tax=Couchioplanes caeruleus TaxID=56438 RepID=UPI001E38B63A|nr:MHYT domain-containing protein [Couchioplanes caeruleus]